MAVSVTAALLAPLSGSAAEPDPAAAAAVGWPPAPPTQLVIDTLGAPIGREDYVPGTVTLDGVAHTTEVRGRGNSSWGWAKKPYKLKLEEDAALVGDVAHDEWVLLANYGDRSGLRTATAFAIAAQTRLAWTPKFRFVDVVLNGQSQGLYMLTEQVEEGGGRVDLPDDGYLLEFNKRYLRDGEPGFRTKRGSAIAFKDPDEVTKKQRRQVRRRGVALRAGPLRPGLRRPEDGLPGLRRRGRLIDWYLVEELFANQDSNFQSSVNFSWVPGKRFVFGPVWDFDLSAGTKWKGSTAGRGVVHPDRQALDLPDAAGPELLPARQEALAGPATDRRRGPRPAAAGRGHARPVGRGRLARSGTPATPTSSGPATPAAATARWRSSPTGWASARQLAEPQRGAPRRPPDAVRPSACARSGSRSTCTTRRPPPVDVSWSVAGLTAEAGVDFVAEEGGSPSPRARCATTSRCASSTTTSPRVAS